MNTPPETGGRVLPNDDKLASKLTASLNDKKFLFICATIRYGNQAATCQNNGLINQRCAVDIADNHQNFLRVFSEKK
ncbi:hypothetical protein [Pantoea sp. BL1]|uniref:hypothetical protein n=1 Tax=Pantoea sp. BL1 TaxID=1628190 RepID=UPI0012E03F61|nr:hypothetical protein [Pantoea sp. BL1]